MASCRSKLRIAVRALVKTRERPPRRIRRRTLQGVVIKIVSLREGTIGSAALGVCPWDFLRKGKRTPGH